MNAATLVSTALFLLNLLLTSLTKNKTAPEIIALIQSAIASLQQVQGTDVTWQQLNDLRVEPTWGS